MSGSDDFLGVPNGGDDAEFSKVIWQALPENIQEKFQDQAQVDVFLRKVEKLLKEAGLVTFQVGLGVDPINGRAILQLQTFFDEGEEQFQVDKELAQMMWDQKKSNAETYIEDLRRAAAEGKNDELGL